MRFKGEHTELVELESLTTEQDEFGEMEETWSKEADIYAEFFERQGKEGVSDNQILVVQDVRCKVRYRSDLDPNISSNTPEADRRIKRGTTVYDIESIVQEGRRKTQLLMLKRRDND